MKRGKYRVKTLSIDEGEKVGISDCANFHKTGSVYGMKNLYYGVNAKLVRCGDYIYFVDARPEIYEMAH